jgi:hypothetical protein
VRWNHKAIACDNCKGWYHTDCIDMDSKIYKALTKPNASWISTNVAFLTLVLHLKYGEISETTQINKCFEE